jgi:hypothetical protein
LANQRTILGNKCDMKLGGEPVTFRYDPIAEGFSVSSLLNELAHQLMAKGVQALSYHITPPFYSQVSKRSSVFHFGYPEDIVATYLDPEILEADPIPDHVMAVGHVMTWKQAVADQKLTAKHRDFVSKAMDLGFVDGVAVPLFGPNSRNSHFSMNFGRDMSPEDEEIVTRLVGLAQSCHRSFILDFAGQIEFRYGDHIGYFPSNGRFLHSPPVQEAAGQ